MPTLVPMVNSGYAKHVRDSTLSRGNLPAQAKANHLKLDPIPEQLSTLNQLELRLISLRVPFMKLLVLPSGKQRCIQGPAVNVPSNTVALEAAPHVNAAPCHVKLVAPHVDGHPPPCQVGCAPCRWPSPATSSWSRLTSMTAKSRPSRPWQSPRR